MSGNITFTMIKPEAVSDSNIGAITEKIELARFEIIAMKMTKLTNFVITYLTLNLTKALKKMKQHKGI